MAIDHALSTDNSAAPNSPLPPDDVRRVVTEVMKPGQFFAGPLLQVRWSHENEEIFWEVFNGRVLDRTKTRQRRKFEAWNLHEVEPTIADNEPVLSVKFDAAASEVHVTRSILSYAWEAYSDEIGAIQSRETVKRNRELIGSLSLAETSSADQLRDNLASLLFLAIVGTSRLPLTSEESPHPAFTFGQWMYCYRANAGDVPCSNAREWIATTLRTGLPWKQKARLLEFLIRTSGNEDIPGVVDQWLSSWKAVGHEQTDLLGLFRTLFQEISLSPYTDFVTK